MSSDCSFVRGDLDALWSSKVMVSQFVLFFFLPLRDFLSC